MIDSRFRKSGTPGSFTFELNRAITLPSKCAGFITDIELVHSWWTVDDHNEYLYFYEVFVDYAATPQVWNIRYHRAAVTKQNWAAAALTAELQSMTPTQGELRLGWPQWHQYSAEPRGLGASLTSLVGP